MIWAFGQRGIKVILDYHRMHLTWDNELGTWFDDHTPESVWIENWRSLANRYKGNPTIIGVSAPYSTVLNTSGDGLHSVQWCTSHC